ncbi:MULTISPECIES: ABC transporter substrate-binding protein [unclassified Achromobacter]|uniref:ABC transporter substrate-binding protein n=1 Tax=unclassified Achromobacter TaxID=2626865 RepID=UPI000B519F8A|nr:MULTISPECIES: ABC transporter substrate-binding protein [unclassified Achromobacter]OWT73741.1 ABC transporter substrate-binding protein [Achromobacter sp. HZ34]OWT79343.1 ABC transporter substrate-binding protein [Achromobacter sp. HZ28]
MTQKDGSDPLSLDRRAFIVTSAMAAVGAALPAVTKAADTPKRGGNMVMIVHPEPATLASYANSAGNVPMITTQVYEGLVGYDWDINPVPSLAKSWEISPDGLTITFHLQEGVTFHNGEPFTSADVQYTFMEVAKKYNPNGPIILAELTAIDTPDPLTAIFRLAHPAPYLMKSLSSKDMPVLCKSVFVNTDPLTNPTGNKPIGTGPFKFVQWERGRYVRLDRNEKYWKPGLPYLNRIVARFIPDAATRSAALEAGEAHYAGYSAVNPADIKRLQANPILGSTEKGYGMTAAMSNLEFNMRREPLNKKEVRHAIAYAIDRKLIVDRIMYGFGKPATGPLCSSFKNLYSNDVLHFDVPDRLAIANKLLDDAGLKRGADGSRFGLTLEINPFGEQWQRQGEYLKQALNDIGIKLTLRSEDTATWLRRCYTDYDFDINEPFYSAGADPVVGVHRYFLSSAIRKGTTFVNNKDYRSPVVDKLLADATREIDPAKRAALYAQAQKVIVEDSPGAWLAEVTYVTIFNKKLHDHTVGPLGTYSAFERAWMET